jgi:hypothetical protein
MPGLPLAYWKVFAWRAGIFGLAVLVQHSGEYDGRVPSMAFKLHFSWWMSRPAEVLKKDSPSGKASSRGRVSVLEQWNNSECDLLGTCRWWQLLSIEGDF